VNFAVVSFRSDMRDISLTKLFQTITTMGKIERIFMIKYFPYFLTNYFRHFTICTDEPHLGLNNGMPMTSKK